MGNVWYIDMLRQVVGSDGQYVLCLDLLLSEILWQIICFVFICIVKSDVLMDIRCLVMFSAHMLWISDLL